MHNIIVLLVLFSFISCTKRSLEEKIPPPAETKPRVEVVVKKIVEQDQNPSQELLEYLRFAGSVETEIFKIVDAKFKDTEKIPSQLMILSQLLDMKLGKKSSTKKTSIFYNCNKIEVEATSLNESQVIRTCEKNRPVIARIKRNSENLYEISFVQNQWQSVIGDSAILNQKDKICHLVISNKKVFEVSCKNTLITIGAGVELEEIKLHHFKFDREAKNQIVITGGRFKDFIERSQINILVPEEGKIKFKEEELAVKDAYAEEAKPKIKKPADLPPPPPPPQDQQELDMNNPQVNPQINLDQAPADGHTRNPDDPQPIQGR